MALGRKIAESNTVSKRFSCDWNDLKETQFLLQGGGRKKKFAEDEDFDDSDEGSEMSDSEFEDPDEMEVGQLPSGNIFVFDL